MAEPCPSGDALSEEEKEFKRVLALIGGREKIHLVSDVGKSKEDNDVGILHEFLCDVFGDQTILLNGQAHSSVPQPQGEPERLTPCTAGAAIELPLTVTPKAGDKRNEEEHKESRDGSKKTVTRRNIYSTKRTIDCPAIIFIFRHTFLNCPSNRACLKEILRDVRARTRRASNAQPALMGLVRASVESAETTQCVRVLDDMMRGVFHAHAPDTIWIGAFIPQKEEQILEIKKHFCGVLYSARTADNSGHRRNTLLWPFQCLLGSNRRESTNPAKSNSTNNWQTGDPKTLEESIPLKTHNQCIVPPVMNEYTVKDD